MPAGPGEDGPERGWRRRDGRTMLPPDRCEGSGMWHRAPSRSHPARLRAGLRRLLLLAAAAVAAPPAATAQERVRFPSLAPAADGAPLPLDGTLFRPAGAGPHPAVVFLHGCGGLLNRQGRMVAREADWAGRLTAAGVAVLAVDSFAARGIDEMCSRAGFRPDVYRDRLRDAYGALLFLQSQPFIRPDRIGAVGWSQGGGTLLRAIRTGAEDRPRLPLGDFRVAVAFYPASCRPEAYRTRYVTAVPLLVLAGDGDVWTPAAPCRAMIEGAAAAGAPAAIHLYPGAVHDFDWPGAARRALPAYRTAEGVVPEVGMDPAAREDALRRVPAFLLPRLRD